MRGNKFKYKTLKELAEAYKSGELTKDDRLIVDNDYASVWTGESEDSDGVKVFESNPVTLLEEALNLLGIEWDYC
jgi:hypothetical protein